MLVRTPNNRKYQPDSQFFCVANETEAICKAVSRQSMRFVLLKSTKY